MLSPRTPIKPDYKMATNEVIVCIRVNDEGRAVIQDQTKSFTIEHDVAGLVARMLNGAMRVYARGIRYPSGSIRLMSVVAPRNWG